MENIETELLKVVGSKKSYVDFLKRENHVEYLYHLSEIRENLLQWYSFEPNASILELNAECGALTGFLCDNLAKVVSKCENANQHECIMKRCSDKENLRVVRILDEIDEKFDYILALGEKSSLSDAMKYLKDDGTLIVATNNRMSLKNLANGLQSVDGRTKKELEKELNDLGMTKLRFYYPMPDYVFPDSIYSDEYLPQKGDLRNLKREYLSERYQTFDLESAFDEVCDNGTFTQFANSFLVFATK